MTAPAGKAVFYGVHVTNRASRASGTGWVWSRPFDRPGEAKAELRRRLREGSATLGFVVRVGPDGRRVLPSYTEPGAAERIVAHYLELVEALRQPPPPQS